MTVSDKYWIKVNKKNIIGDVFAVIFLSVFFNSILTNIAIIYYLYRLIKYSTQYLNMNYFTPNKHDGLNQLLIMPFSRKQIYRTYIKMMLLQAGIFVIAVSLSRLIFFLIGGLETVQIDNQIIYDTFFTLSIYYLSFFCILIYVLITLVKIINEYPIKKFFSSIGGIFLGIDYIFLLSLLFLENNYIRIHPFIQYIYLLFTIIVTTVFVYILIKSIRKSYYRFVTYYRRQYYD